MRLPPGLRDVVLARDFEFATCLKRFGLDWERAKGELKLRLKRQKRLGDEGVARTGGGGSGGGSGGAVQNGKK